MVILPFAAVIPVIPSGDPLGLIGYISLPSPSESTNLIATWLFAWSSIRSSFLKVALPSPWADATGTIQPSIFSKSTEFVFSIFTWANLASNWSERFLLKLGQWSASGIICFRFDNIWHPLQTPRVNFAWSWKNCSNWSFTFVLYITVLDHPPPAPKTSPYEKPPQTAIPWKSLRKIFWSSKSCIWTSTASKPARVKAAAISFWPFTPCSLNIATFGLEARIFICCIWDSSKEIFDDNPVNSFLSKRLSSESAIALLSLILWIACEVSLQYFSRELIDFLNKISASFNIVKFSSAIDAIFDANKLFSEKLEIISSQSALLVWITNPISSENNDSLTFSKIETSTSIPIFFVKHISAKAVIKPPSEISCNANTFLFLISCWTIKNISLNLSTSSMSGVSAKTDWVTSEKIDPANLFALLSLIKTIAESLSRRSSGVTALEISSTGAIAVITPDRGLVTSSSFLPSDHFVFIERESFPTGIDTFKSTAIFDKASTPFLSAKSSLLSPDAAIQLADTWT